MGWQVVLKGRTSTAWPTERSGVLVDLHISAFWGEMVSGISSDLMTWVELRYATLEASGLDEPHKVYICTNGGGNRSDIQKGRGLALLMNLK